MEQEISQKQKTVTNIHDVYNSDKSSTSKNEVKNN